MDLNISVKLDEKHVEMLVDAIQTSNRKVSHLKGRVRKLEDKAEELQIQLEKLEMYVDSVDAHNQGLP